MKKLLVTLVVAFILVFGATTAFADPGGGTNPYQPNAVETPTDDPGGGTNPE